jgi:type I restriction enzyme S subunit
MKLVKLADVVKELESGSRPKGGVSSETGTIPSLGAEHLSDDGGFKFHKNKFITAEFFKNLTSGKIKCNDILIVKDGATTGKVSFVQNDFPFSDAAINEHVFRIATDKHKGFSKYVYFFLKSSEGKKQILNDFRGATVGGISRQFIESAKIPLPPLDDQIRIAAVLTRAEKLIAKRKESIQVLDELLKSTFLEMFGDPVRNEKGWEKKRIDEIADTRLGKMRDKQFITGNHLKYYLGNSNVRWFSFEIDSLEQMDFDRSEQKKFSLQFGDLLVCEGGEIGRCAIWKCEKDDIYFQKALHRVRVDIKQIKQEYVQYVFFWYAKFAGFKNVTSKATIAHLTGEKLKETYIPVPPLPLQNKFSAILEKVEAFKKKYSQSLSELENLYGSLSQRAFKGELDLRRVSVEKDSAFE